MSHETAHIYRDNQSNDIEHVMYHKVANKDQHKPSGYAVEGGLEEDYGEFAVVYNLSKGTACEAPARRRYPARYEYFDRQYVPKILDSSGQPIDGVVGQYIR